MIQEKLQQRLYFYSLLFFALLLPFQFKWLPLTLGMMFYSLIWLLTLGFVAKFKLIGENRMSGVLFGYFLWVIIGGFYSSDQQVAMQYIILKVPFAVWAILLGSIPFFTKKHQKKLLTAFVFALVAAILYSFGESFWLYFKTGDSSYLFFTKLIHFKMIPPHYFGMYTNFAYALVLLSLLHNYSKKWLKLALLILFGMTIIFVSSRMQYLVFAVVNIVVIGFFNPSFSVGKKILLLVVIPVAMFALALTFPGSRSRLVDAYHEVASLHEMVNGKQTNPRKFIWKAGWKVVKGHFWIGTGTGDGDKVLNKELEHVDATFWDGAHGYQLRDRTYNYHNAYLQHWATHGIIGLLLLLTVFIVPFFRKGTTPVGRIFLIIVALSFLTESMLQRQAGVLFFSFFYAVLFIMTPQQIGLKEDYQHSIPD